MVKEHLLIILPFPEDTSITNKIREKFPHIDVQYHQLKQTNLSFEADQGLSKGCSLTYQVHQKILHTPSCFPLLFLQYRIQALSIPLRAEIKSP